MLRGRPSRGAWRRAGRRGQPDAGLVTVYRRQGSWFVSHHDRAADGLWLTAGAVALGPGTPSTTELGTACLTGLHAARSVPARAAGDRSAGATPEVDLSGARSWRAFALTADAVSLGRERTRVTACPMVRTRDYFVEDGEREEVLPEGGGADDLGRLVLRLMGG